MSGRRLRDSYYTAAWATERLLDHVDIRGGLFEPCVGQGHIANVFRRRLFSVRTNDIDPNIAADMHKDARTLQLTQRPDWVVSNPPFSEVLPSGKVKTICTAIARNLLDQCEVGMALLLRLSFWEPTKEDGRGEFLAEHPPTTFISVPRISFTGDGKTDSVGTGWFVWEKCRCGSFIQEEGRERIRHSSEAHDDACPSQRQRMVVVEHKAGSAAVPPLPGMRA